MDSRTKFAKRWPWLVAAILVLAGWLLGAAFWMYAIVAMGLIFGVNRFLATRWATAVTLDRTLVATEVRVGDSLDVGISIRNRSRWFVPWLLIEDVLSRRATVGPPKALKLDGSPLRLVMLKAGQQLLLKYRIHALRRGYYQIGPSIVETGDLLGLHRQYRVATAPQYLTVLPRLIPLVGYEIGSRRPIGEIRVSYRSMEDPALISSIRDYQPGDPLNRVHWRATARVGKLQTKVFQPTTLAGATLLLDLHRTSNPQHHEPVRSDLAVTACASIAHAIYHMQQPFGLVTNGWDAAERIRHEGWETDFRSRASALESLQSVDKTHRLRPVVVPAGRGPEHFQQLHHTLARLECSYGLVLSDLIGESQSRLPRNATVLAIVQQVNDRNALALGMLARRGYAVAAIVNTSDDVELRAVAARLLAYRIPVYALRDEQSIAYICQATLFGFQGHAVPTDGLQLI